MKYSVVTCGHEHCGEQTIFVVVNWPPEFFWCRHCGSVFLIERIDHTDGVTWQLRGYPKS